MYDSSINAVAAHMFIVPNRCAKIDTSISYIASSVESHNKKVERLGLHESFKLRDDDIPVQIWICDHESENWSCHGLPEYFAKSENFLDFIPLRLLKGLKEGDIFTFDMLGKHIAIRASQLKYRYKGFGTFEEALFSVTL